MRIKIILCFFLLIMAPLAGQNAGFDPDQRYTGLVAGGRFSGLEFEKLDLSLFYAFSGRIQIGADMGFYVDLIQSQTAQNIMVGAHFYAFLLNEAAGYPFTLKLGGSYQMVDTSSQYLTDNNYSKTGDVVTLEMTATDAIGSLCYGFFILYEAATMTLETNITETESITDFSFGALMSISFNLGSALYLNGEIKGALTTGLEFKWGPEISLVIPR